MQALSLLIKPASSLCNMRCRYCFYADVSNSRMVKNHGIMRLDTLEILVKKALSETTGRCVFGFQGGEPTLAGLEFFQTLIELEKRYNTNAIRIEHALQTNGLAITDAWAEFFRDNRFLIGVSIDAEKRLHDDLRSDAEGRGTHSRCLDATRLLEKYGVEYNILSVLTRRMAAHPDKTYQFYRRRGFRHLQFIPCLDGFADATGGSDYSLDAPTYGKFLCRFFDLWYRDYVAGHYVSIRAFDNYINMLAGRPPENCGMAGVCTAHPLVEADGSVYPCDFYAVDRYKLGDVHHDSFADMLSGEAAMSFMVPSRKVRPGCGTCEFLPLCRGGCRRDCEPVVNDVVGQNRFCSAYRTFFAHALPRMQRIARQVL